MLHKSPGSRAYALIHSHTRRKGVLYDGEIEYEVRRNVVKQKNVKTNTCYYHPNITPFWFRENKTWYEDESLGFDTRMTRGISWECHLVCEDLWIVEIVGCDRSKVDDSLNNLWQQMWDSSFNEDENLREGEAPSEPVTVVPTMDGKFVQLHVTCLPLFDSLRRQAAGRSRIGSEGRKLFDSLLATAKHLNAPGELFPGKEGMPVDPGILVDHVLSAWITDIVREKELLSALEGLRPLLNKHGSLVKGGMNVNKLSFSSFVEILRGTVKTGIVVNRVVRSSDVIGSTLYHLDEALDHD